MMLTSISVMFRWGCQADLDHNGLHVISPLDWKTLLAFADRHLSPGK
ncbi:MAG: hypothetical protein PSW75_11455 [bacterium]|nr:hypothetical protein [bacterium]MDI1338081.1 hypothetical protein [Lacunisphaera sp.]